ncbi:MAG: 2-oxoacid:ferredoxin oxidoreductase subunit beta [Candidatus Pacebacteria bacterium]|nr:2-oxoacid:ferredoxin oxidoreductase subunit beta [Candidatus Paceibacterota bacterium]
MSLNLSTKAKKTWCPGCTNFAILAAFQKAVTEMIEGGEVEKHNIATISGIGCGSKITDYLNMNTFTSLHGRELPTMTGVKAANPDLMVFGFTGDGSTYDEGVAHLVHAARRNSDINLFVHDNQLFALTTGQATPTSPKGFKGRSTPSGSIEEPMNPLLTVLSLGATFVARTDALDIENTKKIMQEAARHKGFSFVDIVQPCVTLFDTREDYKDKLYQLDGSHPTDDLAAAMKKVQERGDKIPLGVFYKVKGPTFEEQLLQ